MEPEWLTLIRLRLKALVKRRQLDRDLQDELSFHVAMREHKYLNAGLQPAEAHTQARRQFGNAGFIRETCRDMWTLMSLEILLQDLRYAMRTLIKNRGFTAVAVLSLALGIAVNSTIFSVINAIQFRPLPYRDPDRLTVIFETRDQRVLDFTGQPPVANVIDWRKQNHVFEDIAVVAPYSGAQTLTGLGPAERVRIQDGSPNLFALLGVTPVLGRGFDIQEARRGSRQYVLSYAFWKRRFEGSPRVLSMGFALEGFPGAVVGVMPPGFSVFNSHDVDVWMMIDPENGRYSKRNDHSMFAIARLKPNVSLQQAQAEMDTIAAGLAKEYPDTNRGTGVKIHSLPKFFSRSAGFIYPLMGAVGFVLLIACANVANLLMARLTARQKEMTLRASLGASRLRLLRQLLTEALLLAALGGGLGLMLTGWGIRLFRILAPRYFPGLEITSAEPRVLLFTLAISILTGVLFGLAPAVSTSKVRLNDALKAAISRKNLVAPGVLVVVEMALAMVLLVGAGLMINSFLRLEGVNPGLDARNVLTMEVFLQGPHYWQPGPHLLKKVSPEVIRFYREVLSRIERLPGVESAGMIGQLPTRYLEDRTFTILGRGRSAEGQRPVTGFSQVSPALFQTLRIPLKRGRYLTEGDNQTAPWAVVINEALANHYFANEDPLGKYVRLRMEPFQVEEDQPRQIVGVVGDVRHQGPTNQAPAAMYASYLQQPQVYPGGRATGALRQDLVIRTIPGSSGRTGYLAVSVRKIVADLDKDQPVYQIMTMEQVLAGSISGARFYVQLLGIFAAMALIMAAIGIYGVISYGVSERTQEVGIRMALGAQKGDVLHLIVRRGLLLTLVGIGIGAVTAMSLTRVIARLLFGIAPTDPVTFMAVSLLLAGVAGAASYVPAWKAARLDPLKALRYE